MSKEDDSVPVIKQDAFQEDIRAVYYKMKVQNLELKSELEEKEIRIRELESEIAAYENEDTLEENASAEQYRFGSTGETFVKSKGCNEVRCFTSEQGEEMALYIHSLFRPPPPPNGGPATSFEETTEQSLELARLFSERCKRLAAKPRPHALESKLAGQEAMTKVLLRRKDKECEQTVQDLKQSHRAEIVRLKVELEKAKRVAERGVNEVVVRNGFDTKERELRKRIDTLTHERDGLAKALKEERELVQSNHNANAQQREELRQARLDLAEFEATKTRLIELEASVRNKTEVRDACARLEADRRRMQRDVRVARERVQLLQEELERSKDAEVMSDE